MDIPDHLLESHTDASISSVHHILRASRRRLAIILISYRVLTQSPPEQSEDVRFKNRNKIRIPVRDIAREITAIEQELPLDEAQGEPYRNVYTSLIQTHMSRLDDSNVVHYDSDRKTIEPDDNLLAFAVITAITSPVTQMLLHNALLSCILGEMDL